MKTKQARPFLKWAGGKGRMLGHISNHLPDRVAHYYEPFLGGGSVFLDLSNRRKFGKASIGDANRHLINAYLTVRDKVEDLISELSLPKYVYEKSAYYALRTIDPTDLSPVEAAARFICLNRTCFNGLYRVNRKGQFNVPFGRYKNPLICDSANLRSVSAALQGVDIRNEGYAWVQDDPGPGDLVYFDPPYYPLSDTSKFTGYTEGGFTHDNHVELARLFSALAKRGVTTILSNSGADEARKLYRDFEIVELVGHRNVGGPSDYRNPVVEIMVVANAPNKSLDRLAV